MRLFGPEDHFQFEHGGDVVVLAVGPEDVQKVLQNPCQPVEVADRFKQFIGPFDFIA